MPEPLSIADIAREYLSAGLCVLPAKRAEKRPAVGSWKRYQKRLPTEAELSAWMVNGADAICILCGVVSGNTEIIDFDAGGERFMAWWERIPADLRERLVVETTPSGGMHVIYRCKSPICGNLKLAQRKIEDHVVTLIETRGEGGLFLCAPTAGYLLAHGDLCDLPVLTEAERDMLLQAAWDLNECPPHSGTVGRRSELSVGHFRGAADNSNNGGCPPESNHMCDCPTDTSGGRPMSVDISHICGLSADDADICHGAADHSHSGPISANHSDISGGDQGASHHADRPGDDFNIRGDVRAVLEQHGWVRIKGGDNEYWRRPGKDSGTSATLKELSGGRVFYVFSSNAAPFEPDHAYAPFSVYTLLEHGGDFEQAARCLRQMEYGSDGAADHLSGVDISGIMGMAVGSTANASDDDDHQPDLTDPGPMPDEMLRVPGFISEVMDHCLATAPYPNPVLAFAGALSLQAFLGGRKVRDGGDNRTNIYLLGLAHSSAGKDWPRKVNTRILHEVGLAERLGERFASGEGIQDALFQTPSMLFQTDEIDGMLQSINKAKDARHEAIMSTLLTMFSVSNSVFPMRRKAGKESPGVIDQPSLVIFGTAIPNHYYEALSERMLTNGFFARMIILEAGPRAHGQEPSIRAMPERVLETAKWWANYRSDKQRGNLLDVHPVPAIIEHSDTARRVLVETREEAESEYARAEENNDAVGTTVWGRVSEQTRKLALLYAISENHVSPSISVNAAQWASSFVIHQTRRMLFMAQAHVADGEFDALIKRAIEILRQWHEKHGPNALMPNWALRRRLKQRPSDFKDIVLELVERRVAEFTTETASTKPKSGYRLL